MSARDFIHENVKAALVKDGWTITADPLIVTYKGVDYFVDLAAERLIELTRGEELIAVEVKSFRARSAQHEMHSALGQFMVYSTFLRKTQPSRTLFLAIPDVIFDEIFTREAMQMVIDELGVRIIVVDVQREEIVRWIT